jgi:hypothetical protein
MGLFNRKRSKAATAAQGHRIIIAPAGDDWTCHIAGNFPTQGSAILVGAAVSAFLGLELQIHGEDGRIREKNSYGNDPRDIPG